MGPAAAVGAEVVWARRTRVPVAAPVVVAFVVVVAAAVA